MLVEERMSRPVLTITKDVPVQDALAMMRKDHVRRYPVVDEHGNMIGIVTDTDLLNASPSEATTLSVWEINYLLTKITVERVMAKKVLSVAEDFTIEEAASLMASAKVGGLPVLKDNKIVGIITETDLFGIFLEMLGARCAGVRITVEVDDVAGKIHEITGVISKLGGNIHGLGAIQGSSTGKTDLTLKVSGVDQTILENSLLPVVDKILNTRMEKGTGCQ